MSMLNRVVLPVLAVVIWAVVPRTVVASFAPSSGGIPIQRALSIARAQDGGRVYFAQLTRGVWDVRLAGAAGYLPCPTPTNPDVRHPCDPVAVSTGHSVKIAASTGRVVSSSSVAIRVPVPSATFLSPEKAIQLARAEKARTSVVVLVHARITSVGFDRLVAGRPAAGCPNGACPNGTFAWTVVFDGKVKAAKGRNSHANGGLRITVDASSGRIVATLGVH